MSYECFADEIAIDFPSVGRVVERMRDAFLGEGEEGDVLRAEVSLSQREAFAGLVVPLSVPVPITCPHCGGRGETWTEPCDLCSGTGRSLCPTPVRVAVPAGVADGACFRFRITSADRSSVRVEVRVAIRSSAA
jgi:DnaJ-class molecular chaperone